MVFEFPPWELKTPIFVNQDYPDSREWEKGYWAWNPNYDWMRLIFSKDANYADISFSNENIKRMFFIFYMVNLTGDLSPHNEQRTICCYYCWLCER